jgi:hypothetical protein
MLPHPIHLSPKLPLHFVVESASYLMSHPFKGAKVRYSDYYSKGTLKFHAIGLLSGAPILCMSS